ncbi:hypothetical protein M0R45_012215 [Rubus argutus]|uniref:Uncharacterized protein n=1 Tax=Rubus argutus TaxID=59490 RepID=A0AAW1YF05_RUBAR
MFLNLSANGASAVCPHVSQPQVPVNSNAADSSQQLSSETPLIRPKSHSRAGPISFRRENIMDNVSRVFAEEELSNCHKKQLSDAVIIRMMSNCSIASSFSQRS